MKVLLKKALWLVFTVGLTAAAGYAFHFIASRHLGPVRYGQYTVLMALMLAFARPLEALSLLVAGVIVENREREWTNYLGSFLTLSLVAGSMLGGALIIFCLVWGGQFGLISPIAIWFAGLTLIAWALLFAFRGILQGHFIDEHYLINRPVELIGRLAVALAVFAAGGGLAAAIFSSLAGALAGIVTILIVIKKALVDRYRLWRGGIEREVLMKFLKTMLIWLAGGFFIGLDMILVNRQLTSVESGFYAIANLVGKGALLYAAVLVPVIYPRLVRHRLSRESLRYLGLGLSYAAVIFLGAFAIFSFWGSLLIPLFFGEAFRPSAALVPVYLAAVFPIALNYLVINLQAAIGGWRDCLFCWLALVFYGVLLYFCPANLNVYLWRISLGQLACAAGGLSLLFRQEAGRSKNRNIRP